MKKKWIAVLAAALCAGYVCLRLFLSYPMSVDLTEQTVQEAYGTILDTAQTKASLCYLAENESGRTFVQYRKSPLLNRYGSGKVVKIEQPLKSDVFTFAITDWRENIPVSVEADSIVIHTQGISSRWSLGFDWGE